MKEAKKKFLTVPNALTLFRIGSAPLFLVVWFATGGEGLPAAEQEARRQMGLLACIVITVLSEVTDNLDGWFARRWKQVSTFGKLMDPYADAIFRGGALLCFASGPHGPWYPLWMPILLVWRDIGTSIIRTFGMQQGIAVAARFWGKAKAVTQGFVLIVLPIYALVYRRLGIPEYRFRRAAIIAMAVILVVGYLALATYIRAHFAMLRKGAVGEAGEGE